MNRGEIRRRIEEIGIIPSVRVPSADDAMFVAEAVSLGGIPVVEVHLTVPDAQHVISSLLKSSPSLLVGAGGVTDVGTAERCLQAGAQFITSDGLDPEMVSFALSENSVVIPGTLTPTDVMTAWKMGPDFVKVVPCGHVGGDSYIRDLKAMFPNVPMIAAGGVNQTTASGFIQAGAAALGIGVELIPREAVQHRQSDRIRELARRFISFVNNARAR